METARVSVLVPISTSSNTGWAAAGRATLWECIQEGTLEPDDDLTFVSPSIATDVFVVGLTSGPTPAPGTPHTVTVRARESGGASVAPGELLVELLETATVRGSLTCVMSWPVHAWQTFSFQATGITAYSDLRIRFTASVLLPPARMRVTAAQLEYAEAVSYSPRGVLAQPGMIVGALATAGMKRGSLTPCT
jgi:hypothetical protein